MRGRKHVQEAQERKQILDIKKESPNEGTETNIISYLHFHLLNIKKESPNEGTETTHRFHNPQ